VTKNPFHECIPCSFTQFYITLETTHYLLLLFTQFSTWERYKFDWVAVILLNVGADNFVWLFS